MVFGFCKKPESTNYVGITRCTYWQLSSDNVFSAWIALSESNKDNGCLGLSIIRIINFELDISNPMKLIKGD